MSFRFAEWAMVAFIVATIVAGLFGPWLISLVLAALCGGCWWAARRAAAARSEADLDPRRQSGP
ncbi:MAG: hypothetical protein ACO27F_12820 [Beijerinckiaceae bacterium]|jgi:hypothetical protein